MDQFDKYFRELLPDLYRHFDALDLTSDLFLIEWMLTLYSKQLDIEIASRLWDNFLLDGEIFAIKTGLAILKIFEKSFLKQSSYSIIKQLRDMHQGGIDEERLFSLIDSIDIDAEAYYGEIKKQRWGYQKSKVLKHFFMEQAEAEVPSFENQ